MGNPVPELQAVPRQLLQLHKDYQGIHGRISAEGNPDLSLRREPAQPHEKDDAASDRSDQGAELQRCGLYPGRIGANDQPRAPPYCCRALMPVPWKSGARPMVPRGRGVPPSQRSAVPAPVCSRPPVRPWVRSAGGLSLVGFLRPRAAPRVARLPRVVLRSRGAWPARPSAGKGRVRGARPRPPVRVPPSPFKQTQATASKP